MKLVRKMGRKAKKIPQRTPRKLGGLVGDCYKVDKHSDTAVLSVP